MLNCLMNALFTKYYYHFVWEDYAGKQCVIIIFIASSRQPLGIPLKENNTYIAIMEIT